MKFLMFGRCWPMEEAGGEGGGGAAGGGEGGGAAGGGSAYKTQKGGEGGGEEQPKEPTREELAAMSDEDWAKGVLPDDKDAEGRDIDRTFMTQMAKACREAGITPRQMQVASARLQELSKAEFDKQDAANRAAQEQLDAANAAAAKAATEHFDKHQWADIAAAGKKYIPEGSELDKLMAGPLGSNIELLTLLSVVGKTLRGADPGATGAAGSGSHDSGMSVVMKTVPAELLK